MLNRLERFLKSRPDFRYVKHKKTNFIELLNLKNKQLNLIYLINLKHILKLIRKQNFWLLFYEKYTNYHCQFSNFVYNIVLDI